MGDARGADMPTLSYGFRGHRHLQILPSDGIMAVAKASHAQEYRGRTFWLKSLESAGT